MALDLKAKIQAADDIPFEDVEVPEWGVTVRVKGLDVADFTSAQRQAKSPGPKGEFTLDRMYAALIVRGVCDPTTNEAIFTDADAGLILTKSMKVIERLSGKINELSGMDDGDEAKAVEDAGKDS